jgi:hypothetical protein
MSVAYSVRSPDDGSEPSFRGGRTRVLGSVGYSGGSDGSWPSLERLAGPAKPWVGRQPALDPKSMALRHRAAGQMAVNPDSIDRDAGR